MRADLHISKTAAERAAREAVHSKKADAYLVKPQRQRNDDRSWDFGFVAVLMRRGQRVGFA